MKVDGLLIIPETVEYITAKSNYSEITLIDGRKVLSSHNLKRFTTYLRLTRINRSVSVNAQYIKDTTSMGAVIMRSGFTISPSRRKKQEVYQTVLQRKSPD